MHFLGKTLLAFDLLHFVLQGQVCLLLHVALTFAFQCIKSRDITLLTKVCIVKAMAFRVVMYRYERWTLKKAELEELMVSNCGAGEDS